MYTTNFFCIYVARHCVCSRYYRCYTDGGYDGHFIGKCIWYDWYDAWKVHRCCDDWNGPLGSLDWHYSRYHTSNISECSGYLIKWCTNRSVDIFYNSCDYFIVVYLRFYCKDLYLIRETNSMTVAIIRNWLRLLFLSIILTVTLTTKSTVIQSNQMINFTKLKNKITTWSSIHQAIYQLEEC